MKPVTISKENWHLLLIELQKEYPFSVVAIKEKSKRVLGFTSREHTIWTKNKNYDAEYAEYEKQLKDDNLWFLSIEPAKGKSRKVIQLDFYDEVKRTFFLIKYSEFLK